MFLAPMFFAGLADIAIVLISLLVSSGALERFRSTDPEEFGDHFATEMTSLMVLAALRLALAYPLVRKRKSGAALKGCSLLLYIFWGSLNVVWVFAKFAVALRQTLGFVDELPIWILVTLSLLSSFFLLICVEHLRNTAPAPRPVILLPRAVAQGQFGRGTRSDLWWRRKDRPVGEPDASTALLDAAPPDASAPPFRMYEAPDTVGALPGTDESMVSYGTSQGHVDAQDALPSDIETQSEARSFSIHERPSAARIMSDLYEKVDAARQHWSGKLDRLMERMIEISEGPDPFPVLLKLFAGHNVVAELEAAFVEHPYALIFYAPQTLTFLLCGALHPSTSEALRDLILDNAGKNAIFCHRALYFLRSFFLERAADVKLSSEASLAISDLVREIEARGEVPNERIRVGKEPTDDLFQGSSTMSPFVTLTSVLGGEAAQAETVLEQPSGASEESELLRVIEPVDGYGARAEAARRRADEATDGTLVPGKWEGPPSSAQLTPRLVNALVTVSEELNDVPRGDRTSFLRGRLRMIASAYLPSAAAYIPIGDCRHRVVDIAVDDCRAFSTKERVPILVILEVIEWGPRTPAPAEGKKLFSQLLEKAVQKVRGEAPPAAEGTEAVQVLGLGPGRASRELDLAAARPKLEGDREYAGAKSTNDLEAQRYPPSTRAGQWASPKAGDRRRRSESFGFPRTDNLESDVSTGMSPAGIQLPNPRGATREEEEEQKTRRVGESAESEETSGSDIESTIRRIGSSGSMSGEDRARPRVVFKEAWAEMEERIQERSRFGRIQGWRLLPIIIKANDDLRQEQLAAQLLHAIWEVWQQAEVPVWLRPYDIIATGARCGVIEAVSDTISLDSLRRNFPSYTSLMNFFRFYFGPEGSASFEDARRNFVRSLAGYAVACYVLQIKDRHNGNILLDNKGHLIHIDFGFMLGNSPGGNIGFEAAAFKLTNEYVELLGGPDSIHFKAFRNLFVRAFMALRRRSHRITLLAEMVAVGAPNLPCFAGAPDRVVSELAARFRPDLPDRAVQDYVHWLFNNAVDHWTTNWYDKYQRCCVGIF